MPAPHLNIPYDFSKSPSGILSFLYRYLDLLLFALIILYKILSFNEQIGVIQPRGLLAASIGSILILFSCIILLPSRQRTLALYLCNALISMIILADVLFFRYYSDVISIPVLLQISQAGSVKQSVLSLFQLKDLLFIIDLALLIPLVKLISHGNSRTIPSSIKIKMAKAAPVLLLGISLISLKVMDLEKTMGKSLFTNILDQTFFVENIGILNFHVFDLYKYAKKQLNQEELKPEEEQQIRQWFAIKSTEKKPEPKYHAIAKNKNLIVVQVEALQSFVINKKINGAEITPNLNKLLKDSIFFDNYYFQTAQGNTSDAEFLSNVSYYPAKEGSVYFQYAANSFASLPASLKKAGYSTTAMHAYKPSYWNRAAMYRSLGFDTFLNRDGFTSDEKVGWGLGDKSFLRQASNKMLSFPQPFYTFLVTLSSHYPYDAFAADTALDTGEYTGTFLGNYFKAINYTDAAIGSFIAELKSNGLWENSVVVFYGDHSAISKVEKEALLKFLNTPDNELTWAKLQKVPLLIHLPAGQGAGTKNITGGQVDLYPTLANLLGINVNNLLGQDLLNAKEGIAIFRNGSFTDGKIFYLRTTDKVYNLKNGKVLPREQYEQAINRAQNQLWVSDQVLENNLMTTLE